MGKLALAAKITHVPSLYLSELDGPHKGCRQAAIDGHHEIGRRCRELGVDTIVVFDVHWLVNSEYHINCAPSFKGVYTSNELPHFIKNMPYEYPGNPELGHLIADVANKMGVASRAHSETTLGLEYGTLVPMRYMNSDQHFKVIGVSGWCAWHDLQESARFGLAVRKAIEERYQGTVAVFASGSLSHHFANNGTAPEYMHKVFDPFLEAVDHSVVDMWKQGDWNTFLDMLPMYNEKCWGEGGMHDTAMLLGLLGGRDYDKGVEIITPYFGSSGTGQINAIFPVTPLKTPA
ncbi:3,4-dihydroxyphenylacetate 2,3-dioxygenase [Pusillimonas noertemannii]|uniref:3,4-dihydroxyphenylacetate 2,3-dioxygenase n=1 Tax=Pusillimonas noertemannii TaxID=305977 RepID=A0A2U1CL52_9BURK|nr:3,4-dihydroxyphenylacetate 2,3-dioxygenase [Pusillimonas noertemannii]NYT69255.1 3,4-dihydroxyphenylacetate 2,3-dioxygenase [Pusillimonas noertemannii]PVY61722.1 3,4-dihydroxyphenylacetate 2,3-dioxygenase [Pusillimonas noertemannii]TFL09661.1 3,4-dihydroxyphenylacetate 2,3-dioxygenase [Pusillimonas noertemannii]